MATIPTLSELYTAIKADIESEFGVTISPLKKAYLRVLAAVQAGRMKLFYLALGKLQKNIFVDTADPESKGGTLERFGRVKLNRPPFPAIAGEYSVQFVGTSGQTIPAFVPFKADDDSAAPGKLFQLTTAYTLSGLQVATLIALEGGLDSKLEVGDTLTITSPIALVDSQVTVLSEATPPQAAEDIEEYREKAIEAYRLEPQGGSGADYRIWSADAQGVEQTYPYAASGIANTVNLYVEATITDSTDGKGTPSTTILNAVESAIEDPTATRPSRKPLNVTVNYLAITPLTVTVDIAGYVGLTTAQETLIKSEIETFVNSVRPFVGSIDITADKNDTIDTNNIIASILLATPGATFGTITLTVNASTVNTFTFTDGDIPYIDTTTDITFS